MVLETIFSPSAIDLSSPFLHLQLNKVVSSSTDNSQVASDKDGGKISLVGAFQSGPSGSMSIASATDAQTMQKVPEVAPSENISSAVGVDVLPGLTNIRNIEAVKRAQELAAKMGFRQDPEFAPLINMFPGQLSADMAVPQKPAKVPVLRLDAQGREIDEHGNVINMPKLTNLSTLKVTLVTCFSFHLLCVQLGDECFTNTVTTLLFCF